MAMFNSYLKLPAIDLSWDVYYKQYDNDQLTQGVLLNWDSTLKCLMF